MKRPGPETISDAYSVDVLARVEEILTASEVNHRFVGGVIANPIGPDTTVLINAGRRLARISAHKPLSLVRGDGSVGDIDIISFSENAEPVKEARAKIKDEERKANHQGLPYPPVSIEPTHYPNWPKRNRWVQFVSTLDVDSEEVLHLVFGEVNQATLWQTVEPWMVTFEEGLNLTSINPYGLPLRYYMRNASGLKKKDLAVEVVRNGDAYTKIDLLERLADLVAAQGHEQGFDYPQIYETWGLFIDNLLKYPNPLTKAKAVATKAYWDTIGTALAHGKGILEPFAKLGDKFTG